MAPTQLSLVIRVSAQTRPPQRSSLTAAPTQPDAPSPQPEAPASCGVVSSKQGLSDAQTVGVSHTYLHTGRHVPVLLMLTGGVAVNAPRVLFLDAAFMQTQLALSPHPGQRPARGGPGPECLVSEEQCSPQAGGGRVRVGGAAQRAA